MDIDMLGQDSIFGLLNLAYLVICLNAMGCGVAVVRHAPSATATWLVRPILLGIAAITLFVGYMLFTVGAPLSGALAGLLPLYIVGLYVAFGAGILLELFERDPAAFKAKAKAAAIEAGRQWGKVPSSH